jgi:hypothetical protein
MNGFGLLHLPYETVGFDMLYEGAARGVTRKAHFFDFFFQRREKKRNTRGFLA